MEQGSYKTWKALNILEFVKKYLKVFGYFLKLFDIQNGRFVELILHVHIWPNCLKLIWKIQCQILLISNPFSSVFSPWMIHDLECPWIWLLMIYCDHRNVDGVTGTTEYFDKIQNNRYSEIESILKNLSIFFKMLSIFGVSIVLLMVWMRLMDVASS